MKFSIYTNWYDSDHEEAEVHEKAFYVNGKGNFVYYKPFKEIKNIRAFLEELSFELLKFDKNFNVGKSMNYFYFSWLQEMSKLKEVEYEKRAS